MTELSHVNDNKAGRGTRRERMSRREEIINLHHQEEDPHHLLHLLLFLVSSNKHDSREMTTRTGERESHNRRAINRKLRMNFMLFI